MSRLPSRIRLSLAAAGVLLVLLVLLATLQYRWIGEVSEAERDRMHAAAQQAADGVAADFNREISRVLEEFGLRPGSADTDAGIGLLVAADAKRWATESRFPSLIQEVFVAECPADGPLRIDRVNLSSGLLEPSEWPSGLEIARRAIEEPGSPAFGGSAPPDRSARRAPGGASDRRASRADYFDRRLLFSPGRVGPEVLAEIPAILIPDMRRRNTQGGFAGDSRRWVILRLDQRAAVTGFLPELVRRHFGETGEYDVAVLRRADPGEVFYRSRPDFPAIPLHAPDAEVFFFGGRSGPGGPERGTPSAMRPEEDLRGPRREPRTGPSPGGFGRGTWRLVALHRSGSLQAAIDASRRRNLAVSTGVLLLLAAAVATLLVSANQTHRLARQQVEFVAGITHELRTPLAAIRSAGQNLADGVVEERGRVRQYGDLVVREGRRLSELIEQALAHAGIEARREGPAAPPLAIAPVVDEAIAVCHPLAEEMGTAIDRDVAGALPAVVADRSDLRTLLENLIANAVKYGGREGRVLVRARTTGRRIEITVSDQGPGIAASDLPHIFEPFYRGEEADGGRIAGSGLGLSLVSRIARALGGKVSVESALEKGTVFKVSLPAAEAVRDPAPPLLETLR